MTATFEQVRVIAESSTAPEGMFQYTAAAWENAMSTVYEEGEADERQLDDLAMRSLQTILCDTFIPETDEVAALYFKQLGVRW